MVQTTVRFTELTPDGDPIGERLIIGRTIMREFADEPERQIVGVVGDVRTNGITTTPAPAGDRPRSGAVGLSPSAEQAATIRATGIAYRTASAPPRAANQHASAPHSASTPASVAVAIAASGVVQVRRQTLSSRR